MIGAVIGLQESGDRHVVIVDRVYTKLGLTIVKGRDSSGGWFFTERANDFVLKMTGDYLVPGK